MLKKIRRFTQKIPNFVVFSTLQRGEEGEDGKVSQDNWLLVAGPVRN